MNRPSAPSTEHDAVPAMFPSSQVRETPPASAAEWKETAVSVAGDPAHSLPNRPEPVDRSWLRDFFCLPPQPVEEQSRPERAAGEADGGSGGASGNRVAWLMAIAALMAVSELLEPALPISDTARYFGMAGLAVVAVLLRVCLDLHDSDVAWRDRDSRRRMARVRKRLRRLFNIPVI